MTDLRERLRGQRGETERQLNDINKAIAEIEGTEEAPPVAVSSFLAEEGPGIDWILGGTFPRGAVGVLTAGGGVGKTTLLAQIALSLGAGKNVLGFEVYRPHTVLMIQAEGAREAFRQRLKRAARALRLEEPDCRGFIQPERFNEFIVKDGGIRRLVAHTKADVCILDTMDYFHRGDSNNPNDWKTHMMNPLRSITAEFGTAWILVHHNRKVNSQYPGDEEQHRGTTAIRDDADLFLMLKKKKEPDGKDIGNRTLWIDKNKYGASDQEIPLWFDRENAIYEPGWKVAI